MNRITRICAATFTGENAVILGIVLAVVTCVVGIGSFVTARIDDSIDARVKIRSAWAEDNARAKYNREFVERATQIRDAARNELARQDAEWELRLGREKLAVEGLNARIDRLERENAELRSAANPQRDVDAAAREAADRLNYETP